MKADFTRSTYRPDKHYSSVRLQQGRVQLDADWNEAADIAAHRVETEAFDVIGPSGGPAANAGFALVTDVVALPASQRIAATSLLPLDPGDFIISAGRYYVDGVLCENEQPVTYSQQPDPRGEQLPTTPGTYLAFLDVWSHHVTALEDPDIREVALGGPDTATRTKTVWQVRLIQIDPADIEDEGVPASATEASTGRLSARAMPSVSQEDPCLMQPGAGYQRMENQLYRVEIHDKGALGTATFKWSRDNASLALAWLDQAGNTLTVASARNAGSLGLSPGDWLELTDEEHELSGKPGQLVTLLGVDGQTLTVQPRSTTEVIDFTQYHTQPKVRCWNGVGTVATPAANDGYLSLEAGVEVKFESGDYASGDYWQVPARTATGGILWPFTQAQPPSGIVHHYCRLAVLEFDGAQHTAIDDQRRLFPALTDLNDLFSGDAHDAGIHVQKILLADNGPLANDSEISAARFAKGIRLACDANVDANSVNRASCYATLEIPFPASVDDKALWGPALLGYQPLVLAGTTSVQGATIHWTPAASVGNWLANSLFDYLQRNKLETRVLARLTLHGHFIWQAGKPEIALDGDVFGMPLSGTKLTALRLPSGDARRGGDLRMWFWLIEASPVKITLQPKVATATAGSTVRFTVNVTGTANTAAELSVNGVVNGNAKLGTLKPLARGGWTYLAPLKVPPAKRITITAKSLADPSQVATAVVTITG